MPLTRPIIHVRGVSKSYRLGARDSMRASTLRDVIASAFRKRRDKSATFENFHALKDVSFEVAPGEVLGIVGANGAGKSTLLKILSRVTEPSEGEVVLRGRVASLLEVGTGFHPELTGRENVFLNGVVLGMKRAEVARKFDEIVAFSGVGKFLDTPVKRYSSGMYVRLAFAVAAHLDPEILIVDEVLAVGDAEFQRKCLGKMEEEARSGRTILFVSHNMGAVSAICDRALLMERGNIAASGGAREIVDRYLDSGLSPGSSKEWPAGEGPGEDGVRLRRFAVRGGSAPDFRSDMPIVVEMTVDLAEVHDLLVLGFDLLSRDGSTVFRSCHTDRARPMWPELRPGTNLLSCTIPPGTLNRGQFLLAPKAWIKGTRGVFSLPPVLRFDVRLMHGDSPYWSTFQPVEKPGATAPSLDWKME